MKKISITIILITFMFVNFSYSQTWNSGNNSGNLSSGKSASVKWDVKEIDLGKLHQGKPKKAVFKMTNIGGQPIIITKAEGSCGCTKIEYPKRPITPGEVIDIVAVYDAEDLGIFNKTVTLTLNIEESSQILKIKGEVK